MTTYVYRMSTEEANANWITRKWNRALAYIQERNAFFVDEAHNRLMEYYANDLADLRDTERCAQW